MTRTALILMILSLGIPLTGCFTHRGQPRGGWQALALVMQVKTLSERNRRIMGDPSRIERSHELARIPRYSDWNAELIQPTDPEWTQEQAGGLDAPRPARDAD